MRIFLGFGAEQRAVHRNSISRCLLSFFNGQHYCLIMKISGMRVPTLQTLIGKSQPAMRLPTLRTLFRKDSSGGARSFFCYRCVLEEVFVVVVIILLLLRDVFFTPASVRRFCDTILFYFVVATCCDTWNKERTATRKIQTRKPNICR